MAGRPLRPATRRRLGRPSPHQQADRPRAHPPPKNFPHTRMRKSVISGIRPRFQGLSRSGGQVAHVLLTRSPLIRPASWPSPFDLHVLSTPPAFVLSQNQTLRQCLHGTHQPKPAGNRHNKETPTIKDQGHQIRHQRPDHPTGVGNKSGRSTPTPTQAQHPGEPIGIDYLAHC